MSKCVKCSIFYGTEKADNKCSLCFNQNAYKKVFDIEEIHLMDYYELYQQFSDDNHNIITDQNFKILMKLSKNQPSRYIARLLDGELQNFPQSVLYAKQGDELLAQCFAYSSEENHWRYIHAVCPFVLDVWNMKTNKSVLECYYKDDTYPNDFPRTFKKLMEGFKSRFVDMRDSRSGRSVSDQI